MDEVRNHCRYDIPQKLPNLALSHASVTGFESFLTGNITFFNIQDGLVGCHVSSLLMS